MFKRIVLLFFVLVPSFANGGECWRCKLHGECPFPNFRQLMNCSREEDGEQPKPPVAKPDVDRKWVEIPCGRIRASHEDVSASDQK